MSNTKHHILLMFVSDVDEASLTQKIEALGGRVVKFDLYGDAACPQVLIEVPDRASALQILKLEDYSEKAYEGAVESAQRWLQEHQNVPAEA